MNNMKPSLLDFTLKELQEIVKPRFRAKQIYGWLYHQYIEDFNDMKNIPKNMKEELSQKYIDKMVKAVRGELDVKFPLNKANYNREVKRRGKVEAIRVKLQREIAIERLGDLGEWYGVIFEYSDEKDKVVIEGSIERVKRALKDFAIIWREG